MKLSERKQQEIRMLSDASYEALVALAKKNPANSKSPRTPPETIKTKARPRSTA